MSAPDESGTTTNVVAIREKFGGIIGLNSNLTVHADGTLDILDNEFSRNERRKVPQEKLRPLREALSSAEWQEIKSSYGKPGGFYMVIEGSGKHTPIGVSSEVGSNFPVVSVPQILEEVADAFGGSLADGDVV